MAKATKAAGAIVPAKQAAALTEYDPDELAKYAKDMIGNDQSSVLRVSIRGGKLKVGDTEMKDNRMSVVILDAAYENAYYGGAYDPDHIAPPKCYALGRDWNSLRPAETADEPQHDDCAGCKWNAFGSADKGKGKACKNQRRLAVISADGLSTQTALVAPVATFKLPPTSTKNFKSYGEAVWNLFKRPLFGVVTEVVVEKDKTDTYAVVKFDTGDPVDPALFAALKQRRDMLGDALLAPYQKKVEAKKALPPGKKQRSKF